MRIRYCPQTSLVTKHFQPLVSWSSSRWVNTTAGLRDLAGQGVRGAAERPPLSIRCCEDNQSSDGGRGPQHRPRPLAGRPRRAAGRIAGRFTRAEPRRRARAFVCGLLADLPHKNCWTINPAPCARGDPASHPTIAMRTEANLGSGARRPEHQACSAWSVCVTGRRLISAIPADGFVQCHRDGVANARSNSSWVNGRCSAQARTCGPPAWWG
jgi:hypothetical protein